MKEHLIKRKNEIKSHFSVIDKIEEYFFPFNKTLLLASKALRRKCCLAPAPLSSLVARLTRLLALTLKNDVID